VRPAWLVLAALLVCTPARADEAKVLDILFTAQTWQDAGNIPSAIEACGQALSLDPDNAYIKIRLAQLQAAKGDPASGLALIDEVLNQDRDNLLALLWQGHLRLALFKTEEAQASYQRVLELDPGRAWAQAGLGAAMLQAGQDQAAVEHLAKAQDLAGDDAPLHYLLGDTYLRLGLFTNARLELERSLDINPRQPQVLILVGQAYQRLDLPGLALDAWRQALGLSKGNIVALQHMLAVMAWQADQAVAKGNLDEAARDWQAMLKYDPGNGQALLHLKAQAK
jgi:tetratricopeptide (TPR) repeat protein